MIPVRVPNDAPLHVVSHRQVSPDHPLYGTRCPACDQDLAVGSGVVGNLPVPVALVYVGAPPDQRERSWMTGGSVAVHAECAGW